MFSGPRGETLRYVGASAERVVIASATCPNFEWFDAIPVADITVVDWRRDRMVDYEGRPLDTTPRPALNELSFNLTPSELKLRAMVKHLCDVLEGNSALQRWVKNSILLHLESSQPAIENILRRVSERLAGGGELEPSPEIGEGELDEDITLSSISSRSAGQTTAAIGQALESIDDLSVDSKLEAFGQLLGHLRDTTGPRICILTDYLATLFYLAAEIEGRGMKCLRLHGGMSVDERRQALSSLAASGDTLVATRAAIFDDFSWANVTDLVLYDIPDSRNALERLLGRFDRFGRKAQLTVHVLVPSNISDGAIFEALRILRDVTVSGRKQAL